MAGPKDQSTQEKSSSSSKQQSPQKNNFPIEKTDARKNLIGGDEGQNKTDATAAPVSGSSSSPVISGSRKRGWTDSQTEAAHDGYNRGLKEMKKEELEVLHREATCYVCKKGFGTWKAMFGHLKAHQRQTPGAFPPPSFTPPKGSPEKNNPDVNGLKEQLAPTLLNLAYETMNKMSQDEPNTSVAAAAGDASSPRGGGKGLDIDLNEPKTSFLLDLNKSPPPESDDDEEDEDDKAGAGAGADANKVDGRSGTYFPSSIRYALDHNRPSSAFNSTFWTTNSGAPVWNNKSEQEVIHMIRPVLLEDYHLVEKLANFDREHPRGFAVKFYTREGNFDMVGNNFPVLFIRDGMKFPGMIHALKPNLKSPIQENWRILDFLSHHPESLHMFIFLFDDIGIPQDYRHMDGSGVHTYTLINKAGKAQYVKVHWQPTLWCKKPFGG
ncbi:hypothetical protein GQ457_02G006670 [Hibiscus cannabinus]